MPQKKRLRELNIHNRNYQNEVQRKKVFEKIRALLTSRTISNA